MKSSKIISKPMKNKSNIGKIKYNSWKHSINIKLKISKLYFNVRTKKISLINKLNGMNKLHSWNKKLISNKNWFKTIKIFCRKKPKQQKNFLIKFNCLTIKVPLKTISKQSEISKIQIKKISIKTIKAIELNLILNEKVTPQGSAISQIFLKIHNL